MVQVSSDLGSLVLPGSIVELQPTGKTDWLNPLRTATSNRNGIAAMSGLAAGPYDLRVQKRGHESMVRAITVAPRHLQRLSVRLAVDTAQLTRLP